jgi:hypothetical protein
MNVVEKDLRDLFREMGVRSAEKWKTGKLVENVNQLHERLEKTGSKLKDPETEDLLKLRNRIVKNLQDGKPVNVLTEEENGVPPKRGRRKKTHEDKQDRQLETSTPREEFTKPVIFHNGEFVEEEGINVEVYDKLTADNAKNLVGWRELKPGDKEVPTFKTTVNGQKLRILLEGNKANRPFSLKLANEYKEEMLAGRWAGQSNSFAQTTNGQSLCVDWNGQAISLAHRCTALILANLESDTEITTQAIVVSGLDPESADSTDTGKGRSFGDVLFRRGEFSGDDIKDTKRKSMTRELAVATRLVWLRSTGRGVKGGPKMSHPEAKAFLQEHPYICDAVQFTFSENEGNRFGKQGVSVGYASGLLYLFAHSGLEQSDEAWNKAEEFWTIVGSGENLKSGNPILSLRELLHDNKKGREGRGSYLSRDALCSLICKAWNAWSKGDKCTPSQLKLKKGEVENLVRVGGLDAEPEGEE